MTIYWTYHSYTVVKEAWNLHHKALLLSLVQFLHIKDTISSSKYHSLKVLSTLSAEMKAYSTFQSEIFKADSWKMTWDPSCTSLLLILSLLVLLWRKICHKRPFVIELSAGIAGFCFIVACANSDSFFHMFACKGHVHINIKLSKQITQI